MSRRGMGLDTGLVRPGLVGWWRVRRSGPHNVLIVLLLALAVAVVAVVRVRTVV